MKAIALIDSQIQGTTAGEHCGHTDEQGRPLHPPLPITGKITGNVSPFVTVMGVPIAYNGSTTIENDGCCGSSTGKVTATTSLLYHNGTPIARLNDPIVAHNGTATITTTPNSLVSSQ